ncbi:MAG: hypothetical protein ACI4QM_00940 [Alphaproteobacteria bacterium]
MKKVFLSVAAAALMMSLNVQAETVKGKLVDQKGNMLTVQTQDGQQLKMTTTDNTTYRKKKTAHKDKKKGTKTYKKGESYYTPMVDEDEFIEVQYVPAADEMSTAVVEDVIVYDD